MGVVDSQGMFLCGDVVAQNQIQLKPFPPSPGNGGDGVMGFSLCLGKDESGLVRIPPPSGKDFVRQLNKAAGILGGNPHH